MAFVEKSIIVWLLLQTLYTMERLAEITSSPPETANEKAFQEAYGAQIMEALTRLREPKNPAYPQASWQLFKQLHHSLRQKAQKRSSLLLNMEEISERLSQLKQTVIAMPGIATSGSEVSAVMTCTNLLTSD